MLWILRGNCVSRSFKQCLLNHRENEHNVSETEKRAGEDAQFPGAFTPAEHLGDAVPGHRQNEDGPGPPGKAGEAFFAQCKDEAPDEHRSVNGQVACAKSQLMPKNVEGMGGNLCADKVHRVENWFRDEI